MVKIGIMICDRNRTCTGGKCFMSIKDRSGAFKRYPKEEPIEVVGWITCGGCPGERLEFSPAEMKKYGAEVIHLATGFLAGYPPCPYTRDLIQYIENYVGLPVVVGTHPMPQNYIKTHEEAGDWDRCNMREFLRDLVNDREASLKYDSTRPDFLKHSKS
jgi:predicted metal-binding protein